MTPGAVDLKIVDDRLTMVAACLADLRLLPVGALADFAADRRNPAAAESFIHRAIEALFDVTRHLLAKGLGFGALEYRQAAALAAQHGLIQDPGLCQRFVEIAGFRTRLTHLYAAVTTEELYDVVRDDLPDIERLADQLRAAAARLGARPG